MHTLRKLERNRVPNMNAVGRGPAARIQEERLAALVPIEDDLKVSVGKYDAPTQKVVRALAGHALEAGEQLVVDLLCAELVDQLVIVDGLDHTVLTDFAGDLVQR